MPKIIPIRDLKDTNEISKMCENSDEPIFVTKNGYGDMVIMSMKVYEQDIKFLEIVSKLNEAESQIKEGKVLDARESLGQIKKKYEL